MPGLDRKNIIFFVDSVYVITFALNLYLYL